VNGFKKQKRRNGTMPNVCCGDDDKEMKSSICFGWLGWSVGLVNGHFGEKSFGEPSFGEKLFGEKSFGENSFGEKLFGEKLFGEKLFGEKSFGEKSFGEPLFGEKLFGEKSFGEKSFGEKSFGEKDIEPCRSISLRPFPPTNVWNSRLFLFFFVNISLSFRQFVIVVKGRRINYEHDKEHLIRY
jgi:hypothetical protein